MPIFTTPPSETSRRLTPAELRQEVDQIDIGGVHRRMREGVLPQYPRGTQKHLMRRYLDEANTRPPGLPGYSREPWMTASKRLLQRHAVLGQAPYGLAFDHEEIDLKARRCAGLCRDEMRGKGALEGFEAASAFAASQGVTLPTIHPPMRTLDGCRRRLGNPAWWRRNLKRAVYRETEAVERDNGLVQAMAGLYASDSAVDRRRADKARSRAFLEDTFAVNSDGEYVSLAAIFDSTTSNPKNRRAEMMTRLSGFEKYAKRQGDAAFFLTLTVPSRFHACRRTGHANPKYDGSAPSAAQDWLKLNWSRIRAKLHRLQIEVYGFRIAEPQHDGTPHWHMLLFTGSEQQETLADVFRLHLLRESPDEPGAQDHRFTIIPIDTERGSATGYLAKYVSKNIDGHGVGGDLEDSTEHRQASETVNRVETWASLWGIRQFQQIGGPPVGVWRELRRADDSLSGSLEAARLAADSGDWCGYIEAMQESEISLAREWLDDPGSYGEPIGFVTVGIACAGSTIVTRLQEWVISRNPSLAGSRTCVNNCTGGAETHPP